MNEFLKVPENLVAAIEVMNGVTELVNSVKHR